MKFDEEIMEILEGFDLTKSYRDAAELANCSPSTVARYVEARSQGLLSSAPARRDQIIDTYLAKLEELVEASKAKVRRGRRARQARCPRLRGSNARRAVRSRLRRNPTAPAIAAFTGRGCRSPACGSSSTGATARSCMGERPGCSVPGSPGRAFASCWP